MQWLMITFMRTCEPCLQLQRGWPFSGHTRPVWSLMTEKCIDVVKVVTFRSALSTLLMYQEPDLESCGFRRDIHYTYISLTTRPGGRVEVNIWARPGGMKSAYARANNTILLLSLLHMFCGARVTFITFAPHWKLKGWRPALESQNMFDFSVSIRSRTYQIKNQLNWEFMDKQQIRI